MSWRNVVSCCRLSGVVFKSTAVTRELDEQTLSVWRRFSSKPSVTEPAEVCLPSYEYLFNPNILKGKVAFITGGGSGIGFTIAEILMRHGCRTAIASRKLERVQKSAETLEEATGQKCLPIQMDVRQPDEILNAIDKTLSEFSGIDIVINNAAGNFLSPAAGLSSNAYKTVLEIDTVGTFNVSKAAFDKYLQDKGGVILNISATLAYRGQVFQAHAGSAKAAIDALTKHLAVEWGPLGIRVVGVAPGPIADTEGVKRLGGVDKSMHQAMLDSIPLQRAGTKVEIAHTVLFLVSPTGSLITGETVVADGGSWYTWGNSMQDAMRLLQSYQKGSSAAKP